MHGKNNIVFSRILVQTFYLNKGVYAVFVYFLKLKRCYFRYQGLCLLDAVDSLKLPSRDLTKPLILPICDVIKFQSTGQLAAFGKLESGAIRNGSKVDFFKTF